MYQTVHYCNKVHMNLFVWVPGTLNLVKFKIYVEVLAFMCNKV